MCDRRPCADVERIRAALATVATLALENPVYLPIFERLERELEAASNDPLFRVRAVARQMASA